MLVPNIGIVVGDKATLVVDTGMGPVNGAAVMREVAKVSKNSKLYLVTTHYHAEHVAGIAAFPAGTTFVISRQQQKDLDELGPDVTRRFAGFSPGIAEMLKDAPVRKADVLFDREHVIDLGGVRVKLLALGSTHTPGDTMVFVEQDRVLFAGDVVMNKVPVAFSQTSSVAIWVNVLKELRAAAADRHRPRAWPGRRRVAHRAAAFGVRNAADACGRAQGAGKNGRRSGDDADRRVSVAASRLDRRQPHRRNGEVSLRRALALRRRAVVRSRSRDSAGWAGRRGQEHRGCRTRLTPRFTFH